MFAETARGHRYIGEGEGWWPRTIFTNSICSWLKNTTALNVQKHVHDTTTHGIAWRRHIVCGLHTRTITSTCYGHHGILPILFNCLRKYDMLHGKISKSSVRMCVMWWRLLVGVTRRRQAAHMHSAAEKTSIEYTKGEHFKMICGKTTDGPTSELWPHKFDITTRAMPTPLYFLKICWRLLSNGPTCQCSCQYCMSATNVCAPMRFYNILGLKIRCFSFFGVFFFMRMRDNQNWHQNSRIANKSDLANILQYLFNVSSQPVMPL